MIYTDAGEQKADAAVTLDLTGNWRVTNAVDNHNVVYLEANNKARLKKDYEDNAMIMGILFAVFVVFAIILGVCAFVMNKGITNAKGVNMEGGEEFSPEHVELAHGSAIPVKRSQVGLV